MRFGDIAENVNDRVDDPRSAGVDRYVGLEHLDGNNLRIRRWGVPTDVEATKLRFRAGDIIFGRRRAYQRKLAVADFDGICSAHAMVLRERSGPITPGFLPILMQSDEFMTRAVAISVGSLSPTINWTTLRDEEFVLPPADQQQLLATAAAAADKVVAEIDEAASSVEVLRTVVIESAISAASERALLGDALLDTAYGCSLPSTSEAVGDPMLRIPNVLRGEIDLSDLQWVRMEPRDQERYSVREGDILLVRTNGNPEYVGRCVVIAQLPRPMVYASYLIRLRVDRSRLSPAFAAAVLNAPSVRRSLRGDVRSSAGNYNINTHGIRRQEVPLPSIREQEAVVGHLEALRDSAKRLEERRQSAMRVKVGILSQIGS